MSTTGIDVYLVMGNINDNWTILKVFTDYPSAVKYAYAQEKAGWHVKIDSWIAYDSLD